MMTTTALPPYNSRKSLRMLAAIGGLLALLGAARAVSALLPNTLERRPEPTQLAAAASEPTWQVLQVAPAEPPQPRYSDPMPGRVAIDERRAVRIGTPLPGRVTRVYVELGQKVERGAPLLRIASPQLPDLRADLARATLALDRAQREDERVQSMAAARLLPAKEALASSARLRRAELTQREAELRLSALRVDPVNDRELIVRAPHAGVVLDKQVLPEQRVESGATLLQLSELSLGFWIIADVFETEIAGIEAGTVARVHSLHDGSELEAKVEHVSAVVDPVRHSVRVRMHVESAGLRPHQRVEVRFQRAVPRGAAEVAQSALVSDGERQSVFVVDASGRYERRSVRVGTVQERRALIVSGLGVGERVVEQGAYLLTKKVVGRL